MKAKATTQEHTQLIRGALVQLLELQLRSGKSSDSLMQLAQECADEATRAIRTSASGDDNLFDAQDYGSVLKTWHRDANYLLASGFPRPLAIAGESGLRRLIERYYPREHYQRVLKSLMKAALIRKKPDGKWLPTKRCAVFPKLNDELLVHVAEGISKLVQTVTQNVTKRRKEALFERSAKVRSFPIEAGPAFREFVNSQASAFLSSVDDWLEAHSISGSARQRKTCTAGVFTFAFIDELRVDATSTGRGDTGRRRGRRSRSARQLIPQRSP